jgi:membrane fusion protein (multidrug efflux system)
MTLLPGMFTTTVVNRGIVDKKITLPKAAVTFNPFGDLVYHLVDTGKEKNGKKVYTAKQKFVTVGESRGDQVAILQGVDDGEEIITSGQLKLKNGSLVSINNTVQPGGSSDPDVPNQHGMG